MKDKLEPRGIYLLIFSIIIGCIFNVPFMNTSVFGHGQWSYFNASVLAGIISLIFVLILPFNLSFKIMYHVCMYLCGLGVFLLIRMFDAGIFGNFKIIFFYTPVIILTGSLSLSYVIRWGGD